MDNEARRLAVRADADDVRVASAWLEQACGELQVPAQQVFRLDLCLNEALANIIAHGGPSGREAPVLLTLEATPGNTGGHAELEVSDAGRAFNPLTGSARETPGTLAEATLGGVGLVIMSCYSDHIDYDFRDGRNHLTFCVRWKLPG